jgi:hypothetical protein
LSLHAEAEQLCCRLITSTARASSSSLSTIKSRSRRPRPRKVSISIFVDPNKIRCQIDRDLLPDHTVGLDRPEQSFDLIDKMQAVLLANKKELQ